MLGGPSRSFQRGLPRWYASPPLNDYHPRHYPSSLARLNETSIQNGLWGLIEEHLETSFSISLEKLLCSAFPQLVQTWQTLDRLCAQLRPGCAWRKHSSPRTWPLSAFHGMLHSGNWSIQSRSRSLAGYGKAVASWNWRWIMKIYFYQRDDDLDLPIFAL